MDQSSSLGDVGALRPLSDIRRRMALAVILAAAFGASLVFSVLPPILPALDHHFGGGKAGELSAQFAMTLPSLGWLFGGAISGWVLARTGVRRMIIVSLGALGLIGALGGLAPDVTTFLATRLAIGFAGAFMYTACITLLIDIYDDAARPKLIGYMKAMASGAAIPISLSAGVLARAWDWRAPFALYAVFGVLVAGFAIAAVPANRPASAAVAQSPAEKGEIWRLWPVLAMIFFLHVISMMGVTQLPFMLADHGMTSPATLSLVMSAAALFMSVGAIVSGHLQVRFGVGPVLAVAVLTAAAGCVVVGLATRAETIAAANCLLILGCGLYFPQYITLPLSRVGPSSRGVVIGLVQAAMYLGAFFNPILLAPLRYQFGLGGTYVAVGILAATAVAIGVGRTLLRNGARAKVARA